MNKLKAQHLTKQHEELIGTLIDEMMNDTPHMMIDNMLAIMNGFFNSHYGEGVLSPKDVFIISRYMHIYLSALQGFNEEEIRESMEEVMPMSHEEEFEYFKTLVDLKEIMEV